MSRILIPFDDSMRLGQGYNSFLHAPCINDAVNFKGVRARQEPTSSDGSISQNIDYSSRFVDKISDVAKRLNVSAGSSIKKGGLIGTGYSVELNETKFMASDVNAMVSVKVVNQTTELLEAAEFEPRNGRKLDSESFLKIYGDCFISGFVEGGELAGMVSAKVLNVENKTAVKKAIKSHISSCCTKSGRKMDVTLDGNESTSETESTMKQTDIDITVCWLGGGEINPDGRAWTLESLYTAAAAFPSKVAQYPKPTWAILTPYDQTKNFVMWAKDHGIQLAQFETAQAYASELLDTYMEYRGCTRQMRTILEDPGAYVARAVDNAVGTGMGELLKARKMVEAQRDAISEIIDELAIHPEDIEEIKKQHPIEAPELWAARLPIRK
ncbi:hypothetical protein CEP53_000887 [Fusarium sp. AF-6]|nr:hypothetical protein CEP53_000887 [Fusarium sp. AF-6]